MSTIKENVASAAEAVGDAAKNVGHKIASGASQAANYVKEKTGLGGNELGIKERMDVIASCGKKVGVVDHVEAGDQADPQRQRMVSTTSFQRDGWTTSTVTST